MAKEFSIAENGYDKIEVDKYVEMLQSEYSNAVAWGQEMEEKYEELKKVTDEMGFYFTLTEENQNEVIEKVFSELKNTVAKIKIEADSKAQTIIDAANEKARAIVRQAMENSVELRTENTTIMKNLESINKMITVILEKDAH